MNEDPSNELLQSGAPSEQDTDSASPVDAAPETEPTRTEAPWLSDSEPLDQPVSSPPSTPESPEDGLFPPLHISVSALSDVGCVRTNNEDSFGYDEESGIYVVCDGMGGMASGEVASSLAATAIVKIFAASRVVRPPGGRKASRCHQLRELRSLGKRTSSRKQRHGNHSRGRSSGREQVCHRQRWRQPRLPRSGRSMHTNHGQPFLPQRTDSKRHADPGERA